MKENSELKAKTEYLESKISEIINKSIRAKVHSVDN
jgi:hypothetical protein